MPNEKQAPKELKVTDKRIFTSDGEIREEFKAEVQPVEPQPAAAVEAPPTAKSAEPPASQSPDIRPQRQESPAAEERRRTLRDKAQNPETPFANFLYGLVMQGYMCLGMLRDPYNPQGKVDQNAARQMIDILTMLRDKTKGNLTPDEEDFLETHLGELKLAFVQRTKSL